MNDSSYLVTKIIGSMQLHNSEIVVLHGMNCIILHDPWKIKVNILATTIYM